MIPLEQPDQRLMNNAISRLFFIKAAIPFIEDPLMKKINRARKTDHVVCRDADPLRLISDTYHENLMDGVKRVLRLLRMLGLKRSFLQCNPSAANVTLADPRPKYTSA
jgi:hypothetical protein